MCSVISVAKCIYIPRSAIVIPQLLDMIPQLQLYGVGIQVILVLEVRLVVLANVVAHQG